MNFEIQDKIGFSGFDINVTKELIAEVVASPEEKSVFAEAIKQALPEEIENAGVEITEDILGILVDDADFSDDREVIIGFTYSSDLERWLDAYDEPVVPATIRALVEFIEPDDGDGIMRIAGHMGMISHFEVGQDVVAWCYNPIWAPRMGHFEKGIVKGISTWNNYNLYNVEFPDDKDTYGRPRTNEQSFDTIRCIGENETVSDIQHELYIKFIKG